MTVEWKVLIGSFDYPTLLTLRQRSARVRPVFFLSFGVYIFILFYLFGICFLPMAARTECEQLWLQVRWRCGAVVIWQCLFQTTCQQWGSGASAKIVQVLLDMARPAKALSTRIRVVLHKFG